MNNLSAMYLLLRPSAMSFATSSSRLLRTVADLLITGVIRGKHKIFAISLKFQLCKLNIDFSPVCDIQANAKQVRDLPVIILLKASPRTVDEYRESVFQKMNIKSRVGMVLKAIWLKLVEI